MADNKKSSEKKHLATLVSEAESLLKALAIDELKKKLNSLQAQTLTPNFWEQASAQDTMQEIGWLNNQLEQIQELQHLTQDLFAFLSLTEEINDEKELESVLQETQILGKKLQKISQQLSITQFLNGRYDAKSAIISVHSGQGGTEAMDWAEMLSRMYLRFFEKKDWKFEFISETKGEEAGIKEISFEVKAPYAYGYLKRERGTHRLVRLSPFNADNLRQTSFALVEVMPVIDQDGEIQIKEEDLSWHFSRSGGPGGQSVNKTNSAVELTHKPTGMIVKSRQARTQVDNKKTCLRVLKAKLAALAEENLEQNIQQEKGKHQHASWGTQIRNYVLHPYQLVKDTRTQVETSDAQGVLDGDLDEFIEQAIKLV